MSHKNQCIIKTNDSTNLGLHIMQRDELSKIRDNMQNGETKIVKIAVSKFHICYFCCCFGHNSTYFVDERRNTNYFYIV